jgi:hypothetical protein
VQWILCDHRVRKKAFVVDTRYEVQSYVDSLPCPHKVEASYASLLDNGLLNLWAGRWDLGESRQEELEMQ